jgi:hypothetical protein
MKKTLYFETLIALTLTTAAVGRIMYPEVREEEIQKNPFMNTYSSYGIIAYELLSFYFIFFTSSSIKNIYLLIYILLVLPLSIYYLYKYNKFDDMKSLYIYTPDIKSIWIHILIIIIMGYIIFNS